jgi:hypothetical protein
VRLPFIALTLLLVELGLTACDARNHANDPASGSSERGEPGPTLGWQSPSTVAERLDPDSLGIAPARLVSREGGLVPEFLDGVAATARVTFPKRADGAVRVAKGEVELAVRLIDAKPITATVTGGILHYEDIAPHASLARVALRTGTEDFVRYLAPPERAELTYEVALRRVAGLRLVDGVLEFLEPDGNPALRTQAPILVDAEGNSRRGTLAVEGCEYDSWGGPPWGRSTVPLRHDSCVVRARWSDKGLHYPIVVDPPWTTTGDLALGRVGHGAAEVVSASGACLNGCVLVTGGSGPGSSSAELYNETSGTWSTMDALPQGSLTGHVTVSLGSKILVAGGIAAGTATAATYLFDPTAVKPTSVWSAKGNLPGGARSLSAAASEPASGMAFVSGGLGGANVPTNVVDWFFNNAWHSGPVMKVARSQHAMVASGMRVLVAGGAGASGDLSSVEISNTTSWTLLTPGMSAARNGVAAALVGNTVYLAGGRVGSITPSGVIDILDVTTGSSLGTGALTTARWNLAGTNFSTGALFVGGQSATSPSPSRPPTPLFDADLVSLGAPNTFTKSNVARISPQVTLLKNGKALLTGGQQGWCGQPCALYPVSTELFDLLAIGSKCTQPGECKSGNCVDTFCCDKPCNGACDICSKALGATADGTCTPAALGDPGTPACGNGLACDGVTPNCPASCTSDAQCSADTYCTSAGTCQPTKAPKSACLVSDCKDPTIADGKLTACRLCTSGFCASGFCCDTACTGGCATCAQATGASADGVCTVLGKGAVSAACGAYLCDGTQATCPGSGTCMSDADCAQGTAGRFCDASHNCVDRKAKGEVCSKSNECAAVDSNPSGYGYCVDGRCCDGACNSACFACAAALTSTGLDGECNPAKVGTDPHNGCAEETSDSCGQTGQCDGNGACQKYDARTVCGAAVCTGNTLQGKLCNGLGSCQDDPGGVACDPYVCAQDKCARPCTGNSDCIPKFYCASGACTKQRDNGQSCKTTDECGSSFCVDGVCCDAPCTGQCEACGQTGHVGTCSPVKGVPIPPRLECGGTGMCKGTCDGGDTARCTFPDQGTTCAPGMCAGNVAQPPSFCDGNGTCTAATTKNCTPYACDSATNACRASCKVRSDCASGAECNTGTAQCAPASSMCKDATTVIEPSGSETSCLPYKCNAGKCGDNCTLDDDCGSGFGCKKAQCVISEADGGSSEAGPTADATVTQSRGCGCRMGESGARAKPLAAMCLCLALLSLNRRRRPWQRLKASAIDRSTS